MRFFFSCLLSSIFVLSLGENAGEQDHSTILSWGVDATHPTRRPPLHPRFTTGNPLEVTMLNVHTLPPKQLRRFTVATQGPKEEWLTPHYAHHHSTPRRSADEEYATTTIDSVRFTPRFSDRRITPGFRYTRLLHNPHHTQKTDSPVTPPGTQPPAQGVTPTI